MGNATVSFFGDVASRFIILSYSFGSVVRWFDRQFRWLLLFKELRVQVSPFPNAILQLSCLYSANACICILSLFCYDLPTFWFTSAVKAHQFFTEESWDSFKQIFDIYMFEASKVYAGKILAIALVVMLHFNRKSSSLGSHFISILMSKLHRIGGHIANQTRLLFGSMPLIDQNQINCVFSWIELHLHFFLMFHNSICGAIRWLGYFIFSLFSGEGSECIIRRNGDGVAPYSFQGLASYQNRELWDICLGMLWFGLQEWLEANEGSPLLETLYKALDEVRYFINIKRGPRESVVKLLSLLALQVVKVAECEIYTYNPEADADPFLERGAM